LVLGDPLGQEFVLWGVEAALLEHAAAVAARSMTETATRIFLFISTSGE
jgi:hypothetical protein